MAWEQIGARGGVRGGAGEVILNESMLGISTMDGLLQKASRRSPTPEPSCTSAPLLGIFGELREVAEITIDAACVATGRWYCRRFIYAIGSAEGPSVGGGGRWSTSCKLQGLSQASGREGAEL
jgi:hypothetical protein